MEALSDAGLLDVWEGGHRRGPLGRALSLLGAAHPELDASALARVDIFRRDESLWRLRAAMFGPRLPCYADCPACHERLEFELQGARLGDGAAAALASGEIQLPGGARFRLPNSDDLAAIAEAEPDVAVRLLAQRCQLGAVAAPTTPDDGGLRSLPLDELEQALAELSDALDLRLDSTCVACAHRWVESLDIASYLWEEIQERAERVLDDVHILASTYGWTEREILTMSATRRRCYLDRCER